MVRHVVMWKVKDSQNKSLDIQKLKKALEGLADKIKEIVDLEVGVDFSKKPQARADIVLISSFNTTADLKAYQEHPAHLEVVKMVRSLTTERRLVDYNF
jgi:hypothetical protein